MTLSLKHAFASAKSDGTDATLIQPSNWNAEHVWTAAAGVVLGRDTSGAGNIQELPIAVDTSGNVGVGTTSPRNPGSGYKGITLDGSASGFLDLNVNGTRVFTLFGLTNDIALTNPTATGSMTFYTNNTERLRISDTGAFGLSGANYGASGQVLTSSGSAAVPTWTTPTTGTVTSVGGTGTVNGLTLTGTVTSTGNLTLGGTLDLSAPPAIGGTTPAAITGTTITANTGLVGPHNGSVGATTPSTGVFTTLYSPVLNMGYTTTATSATPVTLTAASTSIQYFSGTNTQTINMPVTSTLRTGWSFHICNNSTGNLTVNSSGGNLICTVLPGTTAMLTCIGIALTTAADWDFGFTDFGAVTGTGSVVLSTSPTLVTPALGTPASGVVTNLTGTASININGTVGATTPAQGTFTNKITNTNDFLIQPAPNAQTANFTATVANLLGGIITVTSASAVALTLPTGTLTDAGVLAGAGATNISFDWSVINLGSSTGAVTMTAGTAHTYVGNVTVAISTSARFRTRKTAANTYVTYRIS